MRDVIINKQISIIKKYNNFDDDKISIIRYGLESIYILLTKTIIILTVAFLLGLLKETLIFIVCYNFIRTTAFGLHATKSWICLITSLLIFILIPLTCKLIVLPLQIKIAVGLVGIFFIFKNAPADTYKRPIISKKRRLFFKIISTVIAFTMIMFALFIENNFLSNCLIFSIILQCFMISPTVYKIFKLPYNNYKNYI